ncbi:hypothetical protein JW992_10280, partial [candidate division KSB1 bacterium]|nr:hypothetical protein [candidate division KSB1 bacterium]
FDPERVAFSPRGITGVAYPDDPAAAAGYGVFVVHENPSAGQPLPVSDFLQKPDLAELNRTNAIDPGYRVWIDTGILNFAPDAARTLVGCRDLIEYYRSGQRNHNLYHEILFALLTKGELADHTSLHQIDFSVVLLPYCGFFHIGRSRELLQNYYTLTSAAALCDFRNSSHSNARAFPHLKNSFIYNTLITTPTVQITSPAVIEGCILDDQVQLDGENLLTGIPAESGAIHLQRGQGLVVLPVGKHDWSAIVYGLDDSFKEDTGVTFCNRPWKRVRRELALTDNELWPSGVEPELWTARLFPLRPNPHSAVSAVLRLVDENRKAPGEPRLSLQEILASVNQSRLLRQSEEIARRARLLLWQSGQNDFPSLSFDDLLRLCRADEDEETIARGLERALSDCRDLSERAHFEYLLHAFVLRRAEQKNDSQLLQQAQAWQDRAFATIRSAVSQGLIEHGSLTRTRGTIIRSDEVVWTVVPARLDFAGGWSDTPPVCVDLGGAVLNAAVTLNGQYPIQVMAKRHSEPVIRIHSIDLGAGAVIRDGDELMQFTDPADWRSLPKSAFFAAGIVPMDKSVDLQSIFKELGGGIDLTLFSALPSGSGLGTSSILGTGIIATLSRLAGIPISSDELFARTSYMEQLMTTGGGWQDQIGGAAGGVKLLQTAAGYRQEPILSWTQLVPPGQKPTERFLLYYTGYRRMAKNILRQIVGRYLGRDRVVLQTLEELKDLALAMKDDLDHRQLDEFGARISRTWECNKRLDNGSTTPEIEEILNRISPYAIGAKLLGAGGGGFLFIVAQDSRSAAQIRQILEKDPPNDRARFFDFAIDPLGIRTTVL